jgi:hypothetical protein
MSCVRTVYWGRRARIVYWLDLQLTVQLVSLTTKNVTL